jgi:hypothetical protein
MLYVATAHYKSPRWIEIQASYLRRHVTVPYQTWASIEGIDGSFANSFDRVLEQRGPHPGKLNHLALEICHVARDDDLIMFLDGDAFPIADPMPIITHSLRDADLVAVRRAENLDEPQPHPCFCVTTVGTWRKLPGDWSLGSVWPAGNGRQISDVGANLLRALTLTETPWVELLRSNGSQLHELFFAIYGDVVYHHGAGFRDNVLARGERARLKAQRPARRLLSAGLDRVHGGVDTGVAGGSRAVELNNRRSRLIYDAIKDNSPNWLDQVKNGVVPGDG